MPDFRNTAQELQWCRANVRKLEAALVAKDAALETIIFNLNQILVSKSEANMRRRAEYGLEAARAVLTEVK